MGRLFNQITSLANLGDAWDEVARTNSGPGCDGVTIEDFARNWEENLIELRRKVRANQYRPAPLLKFSIPKKDGSRRWLANMTVRDKIVQRATMRVLDDIYEPYFLDCSFAYRKGRSVQQAVERVVEARNFGRVWVLDADLDDFFHSLDHHLLLRFLQENISDPLVLRLIVIWLNEGRPDPAWAMGTPLGAIISPLLSNIYLHYLDLVMTHNLPRFGDYKRVGNGTNPGWVYVRFADDFVVLCRRQAEAELALKWVETTVQTLQLQVEPSKTSISNFDEGFDYLGCTFKGDEFWFEREGEQIRVRDDEDWPLFYNYGPQGYPG